MKVLQDCSDSSPFVRPVQGCRGGGRAGRAVCADRRSHPETVARDLHARIPGSKLVILHGVGHQSEMEAPDRFNAEVRSFLRSVPE